MKRFKLKGVKMEDVCVDSFFMNDYLNLTGFVAKIQSWKDLVEHNQLEFSAQQQKHDYIILLPLSDHQPQQPHQNLNLNPN